MAGRKALFAGMEACTQLGLGAKYRLVSAGLSQLVCFVCAGIMPGSTVMDTCGLSAVTVALKLGTFLCSFP